METFKITDVQAAIEVKNAPSKNIDEARKFIGDIEKLSKLQTNCTDLSCYCIVLDMSLSFFNANSVPRLDRDWLAMIPGTWSISGTKPSVPFVEIWFIEPNYLKPCRKFVVI
jgi:hypothetical protein